MEVQTRMEFAVDMRDATCVENVRTVILDQPGIELINIDLETHTVLLETTMPSGKVHELLEHTGNTVVFRGHGHAGGSGHTAAAVAHVFGKKINGLVRFVQTSQDNCIIDGTIDGLTQGKHAIHINEFGDLSDGCNSTGGRFNPSNESHEDQRDTERHVGDLGNIISNEERRAFFKIQDCRIKVNDIIGRSLVIDENQDEVTAGTETKKGVACGIIARSAGLFQNQKMICQCSGQTLWEERRESKETFASQL